LRISCKALDCIDFAFTVVCIKLALALGKVFLKRSNASSSFRERVSAGVESQRPAQQEKGA